MALQCPNHGSHKAVILADDVGYCQKCKDGQEALVARAKATRPDARDTIDEHAHPRRCFMTFLDMKSGWLALEGTGCAHFVAHNKGIQYGATCLTGFTYKVKELADFLAINGRKLGDDDPRMVGDIWISQNQKHTGIVSAVNPDPRTKTQNIFLMHASSDQHKVATRDACPEHWKNVHHGAYVPGTYYRYGGNSPPTNDPSIDGLIAEIKA